MALTQAPTYLAPIEQPLSWPQNTRKYTKIFRAFCVFRGYLHSFDLSRCLSALIPWDHNRLRKTRNLPGTPYSGNKNWNPRFGQ